jgi:hypothetical protein
MIRFKKPLHGITDKESEPKAEGIDTKYHKTHNMRRVSVEPKDNGYGVFADFEPKKSSDKNASHLDYEKSHPKHETVHESHESALAAVSSHLKAYHSNKGK